MANAGCFMNATRTAAVLLIPLLVLSCTAPSPPVFPHEDALYIWQRTWNDATREGVMRATDSTAHIMVLAHEAGTVPIRVDWAALGATDRAITLVFRYPNLVADQSQLEGVVADIEGALASARGADLYPIGIQLDFDSPTSKLDQYGVLIAAIRLRLDKELAFSITTLPTWLTSESFAPLVRRLDYFVLQVHSFEPPESIEHPMAVFDPTRLTEYLTKASAVGIPFYVAFPTHGYQVTYDNEGDFAGLVAEAPASRTLLSGFERREVRAEPSVIAAAVRQLLAHPPAWYRGNIWFRMPVATDTRNWTWPALEAVMVGRVPTEGIQVELRHSAPGLVEVWAASMGEDRWPRTVSLKLMVPANKILARDCHNGFSIQTEHSDYVILRGPISVEQEPEIVGWFRMQDDVSAQEIEVQEMGETE